MLYDTRAIGVFDSGVGGLTVLRALRQCLPQENFIYLGDTARLPYGTKSKASVQRYATQAVHYLLQYDLKLLILACNTVTADALNFLQTTFAPLPIIGVIKPGAQAAIQASKKQRIGVLATRATKLSGAYQREIQNYASQAQVFTYAAPLLVPLAEEGWVTGEFATAIVSHYLQPVLQEDIDCLVLGCTHYPAFLSLFQQLVDKNILIVDSAYTTALTAVEYLRAVQGAHTGGQPGCIQFYSTDDPQQFAKIGSLFLGETLLATGVKQVDL